MKICIVGGGKVGYYLAKTMLEHGHTPVLVEQDLATSRKVANELGLSILHGDGTKPAVLARAGLDKCQAFVAVTGQDEDNLIACQLAKQVYKVKRTVARVNNPKNTEVLKTLGVDIAVSATNSIAYQIEREVETAAIRQVLSLASGTTTLSEVLIADRFPWDGKTLADIPVPPDVVVISVTRGNDCMIPRGNTDIRVGDQVLLLAKNEAFSALARAWKLSGD